MSNIIEFPNIQSQANKKEPNIFRCLLSNGPGSDLYLYQTLRFRKNTKAYNILNKIELLECKPYGVCDVPSFNDDTSCSEFNDEIINILDEIYSEGTRPCFELQSIVPGEDINNDIDPILYAIEQREAGYIKEATQGLNDLLALDNRCIDAYNCLGHWQYELGSLSSFKKALNFYKIGTLIGLLSMKDKVYSIFSWNCIDNRPLLRCMHGLGLSYCQLGQGSEAISVFTKMLWLNPSDNQGIRHILNDLLLHGC